MQVSTDGFAKIANIIDITLSAKNNHGIISMDPTSKIFVRPPADVWIFWEAGKSRFLEVGKSRIWGPGNQEIWDPKNGKIKIPKIQTRSAQNVDKVWISRKKNLLASFGVISGKFFHGPTNIQKLNTILLFSLVGQWAVFTWFPCVF